MLTKAIFRGAMLVIVASLSVCCFGASEPLSLQQAVDCALKKNPTIAAGRFSTDAAKHAAKGAKALSNPELIVAPSVVGNAGSDSLALFIQPLEINGIRRVRGAIAANEANAVGYDANATARDVILLVKEQYWDVVKAQDIVKLNQENVNYLETISKSVQKQVDVGTVPGSQMIKTDVELTRARQELLLAQLDLANAKSALATLLGSPGNTDILVCDPLIFKGTPIDKDAMLSTAMAQRPELASVSAQIAAAKSQVKAARLRQVPDLAIQARKESFGGDGGVAVVVNLPFIDWGSAKAERKQAESTVYSKTMQHTAVKNQITSDVQQAVNLTQTTSQVVSKYQSGILDKSEQLAAMAHKGYEKGATNYLDVLEAQRTLRSVRMEYISALANHAKAVAQLEWATGCNLINMASSEVGK